MPLQNLSWFLQGPQPLSYIPSLFPKAYSLSLEMLRWYLTLLEEQSQHSVPPISPETELWPLQLYEHIQIAEAEIPVTCCMRTYSRAFFGLGRAAPTRRTAWVYTILHTLTLFHVPIASRWQEAITEDLPSLWPHPVFCLHQNSHSYHQLGASGKHMPLNGSESPWSPCRYLHTTALNVDIIYQKRIVSTRLDLFRKCQ